MIVSKTHLVGTARGDHYLNCMVLFVGHGEFSGNEKEQKCRIFFLPKMAVYICDKKLMLMKKKRTA